MKVKCIEGDGLWIVILSPGRWQTVKGPKRGEICTVIGDVSPEGYDLEGWPSPDNVGWYKTCFVPLIDDSIDELINMALEEEELELV